MLDSEIIKRQKVIVSLMSDLATVSGALCVLMQDDEQMKDHYLKVLVRLRDKLSKIHSDVGDEIRRFTVAKPPQQRGPL